MKERVAVGYIRVSSKEQAETKLSLTHQREKINALAVAHDIKLERILNDEAESAKDLNRPAVQELIRGVEQGEVEHVIIYKLDRLIRNVENLGYLLRLFEKHDVTLSSVSESLDTSTAGGKLVVNLLGSVAQWERETIAERTVAALSVKRARGERLGGYRPFGWSFKGKRLVEDPKEQAVLKAILKGTSEGKGYSKIAAILNRKGIQPARGKKWYASSVRSVVLRAKKAPLPTEE